MIEIDYVMLLQELEFLEKDVARAQAKYHFVLEKWKQFEKQLAEHGILVFDWSNRDENEHVEVNYLLAHILMRIHQILLDIKK